MDIALQNELDNIRAQLSQKGELARDKGHWKACDLGTGGRGCGRKVSSFVAELGAPLALYVQESWQLLRLAEKERKGRSLKSST